MRKARLTDIITDMDSGGRPKGGAADSGILSVGGEHIGADGSFLLESKRFIPEDYFAAMRRGKVQRNDILIVKDGATTGKVAFVDGRLHLPAAVNEHVFRLAVDPAEAEPRYIFYHLLGPLGNGQILKDFRGATVGGISQDFPENIEFPLPSLSDQRRIAGMLEQADRLRRTRRYALDLSDTFLPAAFLEMFGDPVDNPHLYPTSTLEDELLAIESGFSPLCEGPRTSSEQWAVLGLGSVTSGVFKPQENKVLPPNISPWSDIEVRDEDVLVTRKNTYDLVAACVLVRDPPPRLLLPDTIFRFVIRRQGQLVPAYLWALFSSLKFRKRVQSLAGGSAGSMPNISKEKFMGVELPAPPLPLQKRFADLVRGHERLRAAQRESLRQAEHLFQSLLHRVFAEGK